MLTHGDTARWATLAYWYSGHLSPSPASIGEELSSYKEQLQVACERVDLLEGEGERWRHRSEEVDREGQRLQALLKEKAVGTYIQYE